MKRVIVWNYRLAILSNFPETFPPTKYSDLLPEARWELLFSASFFCAWVEWTCEDSSEFLHCETWNECMMTCSVTYTLRRTCSLTPPSPTWNGWTNPHSHRLIYDTTVMDGSVCFFLYVWVFVCLCFVFVSLCLYVCVCGCLSRSLWP